MSDFPPQITQIFPNSAPEREDVPARIKIAMDYLNMLSFKTMVKPNTNSVSIGEISGTELSEDEVDTRRDALILLSEYFNGIMKPTKWDNVEESQFPSYPTSCVGKHGPSIPPVPESKVVDCPMCITKGRSTLCPMCKGTTRILITPFNE